MKKFIYSLILALIMITPAHADKDRDLDILVNKILKSSNIKQSIKEFTIPTIKIMNCSMVISEPDKEKIKEVLSNMINIEELKTFTKDLYDKHFTEEEVKQIVDFYNTKAGAKMLQISPQIMMEISAFGMEQAQKNLSQLEKILSKIEEHSPKRSQEDTKRCIQKLQSEYR